MNQYYVIKRSVGYLVKAFTSEEKREHFVLTAVRKATIPILSYV